MSYYYPQQPMGYMNPYANQVPQIQQPQYQNSGFSSTSIQQPMIQNQYPTLYGKVVDGIEIVKSQEVPIGSSAIYPKADGSCVYVKSWCNDGTTRIDEYNLSTKSNEEIVNLDDIKSAIESLSKKIDAINKPSPTPRKKKVEEVEDYE